MPTRTPTTLRESSRRLKSRLILAKENIEEGNFGQDAEMLALEAVELVPEDPRPWQALAEACDAQGVSVAGVRFPAYEGTEQVLPIPETSSRNCHVSSAEILYPSALQMVVLKSRNTCLRFGKLF